MPEYLADATAGMKKEPADFTAMKTELADKIDTLGRVIRVLEHEMAKNAAAFTRVNTHSRSGLLTVLKKKKFWKIQKYSLRLMRSPSWTLRVPAERK